MITGGNYQLCFSADVGISAWIACTLAMAAGEYISVSSQKDCEEADIQKEKEMQAKGPEQRAHELDELTGL